MPDAFDRYVSKYGPRARPDTIPRDPYAAENAPIPEWQGPIQVAEPVSVEAPVQEEAPIPEWQGPIQTEPAPTQKPDAFDQYVAKYGEQTGPDAFDQYVAKYGQQERRAGFFVPIPERVAAGRVFTSMRQDPSQFERGIRTGLESARVGVGETLENVGARGIGQVISEAGRASQAESVGRVQKLEDIKSPRDLVDWTAFAMGQGVGSMAAPVLGALAGAAVAGPPGAVVGALGPSYVMLLGEIRGSLEEADVDGAIIDKVAPLAAIPAAAMDAILPGQVGRRAVSGVAASFGRELAGRVAARAIRGAVTEGITEAGQEAIIKGTTAALSENVEFLTMETLSEMTNAMAAGALPGAGFGGISAVSEGRFAPPTVPEPGPLQVQPEPEPEQVPQGQPPVVLEPVTIAREETEGLIEIDETPEVVAEVEATSLGQDPGPTIEVAAPGPEGRIVSLRKEEGAEIRDRLGLDALPAPERQSFEEVWDEAISQTAARHAVSMANQAAADGRPLTPVEHAAAVQRYVELERELGTSRSLLDEASKRENDVVVRREEARSARLLDEIDILTTATDRTGTEAGRALSVRRLRADVDEYSLARGLQSARTNKGAALMPSEISQIATLTKEMETLQTTNESLVTENASLTSKREKSLAQATVKTEVRTADRGQRTTTRLEKLTLERTNLLLQLGNLGYRLNDVTGVSVEGLGLIGKLAVNSIRVAAVERGERLSLDAVVKEVLSDLNNESITERDVHEALAGRSPKAAKRAESMAQQHVRELKTQANLLARIDDAERGVTAPTGTRAERSVEVKALQKILTELRSNVYSSVREGKRLERALRTIDELQDQLAGRFRPVRAGAQVETAPDMEALKEQIAGLRRELRTEDALSDVQEQLRTGDFKIPQKREAGYTSPALERNQIALRKARKQWRQAIADMRPMGPRRVVGETTAFLRTMKATADMSATLRQAFLLSARRPVMAAGAFGKSAEAFFSENTFDQIDNAIRERPMHLLGEKAGLELTERSGVIGQREEDFASNLAERIPVFGVVVRASNRSMQTTLNLVRSAVFDQFVESNPNATSDELKAWANWVNVASGRGDLGRAGAIATELSTVFFAPRFAMSRIQTPFMVFKHWQQPRVRKEIAKDYAAVLGVGMTTLALAAMAGLEVGLDPREPDFGRIRFGDNRVDIWAGVQQPMRLLARTVLIATDRAGLTGRHLSGAQKDVDPLELLGRFAAFKAGPAITLPREILLGKSAVGEPRTLTQTAARSVTPIILEGVYDAYQQEGAGSAALVGAGEFLGLGVQTYGDSEGRVRRDAQKLLTKGDREGASALVREWNKDNPERRIVSVRFGETGSTQRLAPPRRRPRAGPGPYRRRE